MIYKNEIVMMLIAMCTLLLTIKYSYIFTKKPHLKPLMIGFYCFVAGCIFTIVEGFIFPETLNILEHFSYLIGSCFIVVWSFNVDKKPKQKEM